MLKWARFQLTKTIEVTYLDVFMWFIACWPAWTYIPVIAGIIMQGINISDIYNQRQEIAPTFRPGAIDILRIEEGVIITTYIPPRPIAHCIK
jgi:hypothetical protein